MTLQQFKKHSLAILLVIFITPPCSSVSTFHTELNSSKANYLLNSAIPICQTNIYTPDFNLKSDSIVIPLKRAGRLFLIEAKIDDQTGNLVFDTGANGLVLNNTYFRDHVKTGGNISTGITGGVGVVEQITANRIEFSELSYKNIKADLVNLGHIENHRGVKILGLIGFSMMRNLEIIIDAKNSTLKLIRIDKKGERVNSSLLPFRSDYSQKIEGNANILFLRGRIAGKNLNFCFDTAAETNAISSDSNKSILSTLTITRRSTLKGAGSVRSEVLFGRMNEFMIGENHIGGMETIITNLDTLSEAYNTKTDGMLGYNFLEQGIFCINFVKKQFGIRFTNKEEK